MTRIAVTGHMNLTPDSGPLIYEAIKALLAPDAGAGLVGLSCLARGADSIFAEAVLDVGGTLEVVLPSSAYRQKVHPDHVAQFDALLRRATTVRTLPHTRADREAYAAANQVLLNSGELLIAVWDGQPGVDRGSTAEVVRQARTRGLPVHVVWPLGVSRAS